MDIFAILNVSCAARDLGSELETASVPRVSSIMAYLAVVHQNLSSHFKLSFQTPGYEPGGCISIPTVIE